MLLLSICISYENVFSGLFTHFLNWGSCISWIIHHQRTACKYLPLIQQAACSFCYSFPLVHKSFFSLMIPFVYVFVVFVWGNRPKNIAKTHVKKLTVHVFSFLSQISKWFQVPCLEFLIHFEGFCIWCEKKIVHLFSFTSSCPVFPTPFTEDAILSPSNIHVSFVIDWLTIQAWVYFWSLHSERIWNSEKDRALTPLLNVLWNSLWRYLMSWTFWISSCFIIDSPYWLENFQSVHIFIFFPNSLLGDCVFPGTHPFIPRFPAPASGGCRWIRWNLRLLCFLQFGSDPLFWPQ